MDVFVLAGQSNMAGRGGVYRTSERIIQFDGVLPPPVCALGCPVQFYTHGEGWAEADEPLHQEVDNKKVCGIGPGMSFARQLLSDEISQSIGLIPCAVGGTEILEWQPGKELFQDLIARSTNALSSAPGGSRLRALLWYQGESDCDTEEKAEQWTPRFKLMLGELRSQLAAFTGNGQLPVLLVVITCADLVTTRYAAVIRESQLDLDAPALFKVDAKGLQLQEDGLHLTTNAQVELGRKLAEVYRERAAFTDIEEGSLHLTKQIRENRADF